MGVHLTAVGLKFVSIWLVLLLFSMTTGLSPTKAAWIAVVGAVVSWMADRVFPFRVQGVTRWAIDSGLAALTIYLAQFLWRGAGINFYNALFAGFLIGAIEIPLHFLLAARFGVRRPQDDKDGIR